MSIKDVLHANTIIKVVGVTNYSEAVRQIELGDIVQLIPEPTNTYDPNAVNIIDAQGNTLGYVPAALAERLTREIGAPMTALVTEALEYDGQVVGLRLRIRHILSEAG